MHDEVKIGEGFLAYMHRFLIVRYLMDPSMSPEDPPMIAGLSHVPGVGEF
jgi:hypothetical protein